MAFVLDMEPDIERQLRDEAEKLGMDASLYAAELVARSLPPPSEPSLWERLTPEEWVSQAREYTMSHASNLPRLPAEALTREGLYGECW